MKKEKFFIFSLFIYIYILFWSRIAIFPCIFTLNSKRSKNRDERN